jgi:hypothetical protein
MGWTASPCDSIDQVSCLTGRLVDRSSNASSLTHHDIITTPASFSSSAPADLTLD